MTETITRLQAGEVVDPYSGLPTGLDWDAVVETEIPGCIVAPSSTLELIALGRDQSTETLTILTPHGVTVDTVDRVRVRGNVYTVDGFLFDFTHPFTEWAPGGQVTVSRKVG